MFDGVLQSLEVLVKIVDEIFHYVELILGVVVVLGQLAHLGHHVVDSVVHNVLIFLENIDEPHKVVVVLLLDTNTVPAVKQRLNQRDSHEEDADVVDYGAGEATQFLTGGGLLRLLLHGNLGWLWDRAGLALAADQLGLVDGLDLSLNTHLLVLEVNDGVRDKPGEDWNLVFFLSSGGK